MCLIALAWKAHPRYRLVVAANRDEWRDRSAEPAHWWPERPGLLAGRDLRAGGTWLGVTRGGRFGAITNFRDPAERDSQAPSRGGLLVEYLTGAAGPREFLAALAPRAPRYNAFNLLLAEGEELFYFGSREGAIVAVTPGVHALSNHLLDEPWPKVRRAASALDDDLSRPGENGMEDLFAVLSDVTGAPDRDLPDTGVGLEWERKLAPILIRGERYGTRCSTVLRWAEKGSLEFEERTRDAEGKVVGAARFSFQAEALR